MASKTIPELQEQRGRKQAEALNAIFAAHKASLEVVLDLTDRENELLSAADKNREFARARAEVVGDVVGEVKQAYLDAETQYFVQEQSRVAEIMTTLFGSAAGLPPTEVERLLTAGPEVLDQMLTWALGIGDMDRARHVLYASHVRDDAGALHVQERWRQEVDGGPDDLALLGELALAKGNIGIEQRLKDAELNFEEVRPSWSTDQLLPKPGESVRVA